MPCLGHVMLRNIHGKFRGWWLGILLVSTIFLGGGNQIVNVGVNYRLNETAF